METTNSPKAALLCQSCHCVGVEAAPSSGHSDGLLCQQFPPFVTN